MFIALTVIVILIIIITADSPTTAIAIIVAMLAALRVCGGDERWDKIQKTSCGAVQRVKQGVKQGVDQATRRACTRGREHFEVDSAAAWPYPGVGAPYLTTISPGPVQHDNAPRPYERYPGAIEDIDVYDEAGPDATKEPNAFLRWGYRDRLLRDKVPEGNYFPLARTAAPVAADPCIDDEATNEEMDGDELLTYQGRARNDATRVTAGTMNRRRWLDPYLREELEARENTPWFSRHEV